ncbi:TAF11 [Candida pseudojiufengensis]|uniref:TAF11 n=1 Tax=Candida pseudojiufengensis TaxID=497109 RepID=UPI0022241362|nr:TAF11 [Candida pseudojiufengensis]KAI5962594.1 TAF11 [Candida pseudojiufengensis]
MVSESDSTNLESNTENIASSSSTYLNEHDEESSDENSDVSLDEEDEELIWRVFFSQLEKHREDFKHQNDTINESLELENEIQRHNENEIKDDDISLSPEELKLITDSSLISRYRELKTVDFDKTLSEEDQKRLLISNFTNTQMERFEAYRRSTINKPGVKKLCNAIIGHSAPQVITTVVAGVAKSFMGELITKSFEIQERDNKGKLLMDIENKKLQKSNYLKTGKADTKQVPLNFAGDRKQPLQPSHVREAWRLYEAESSGFLK